VYYRLQETLMYWLRRRLFSQNFFSNRELISKLIRDSFISSSDTVLDIGAGSGVITRELLKVTPHVIAIEKDSRFTNNPQDFLTFPLPAHPYKVFANIPFSITADIIRKLLQSSHPPSDCYLIIQAEAARKFIINTQANTMSAMLYYPWWKIQITYKFSRSDFQPAPKVNSVLLHIQPRPKPMVPMWQKYDYLDFITYNFIHNSKAKFISPSQWLSRLKVDNLHRTYSGSYTKLLKQQDRLQKIHRTRVDKNWRMFR